METVRVNPAAVAAFEQPSADERWYVVHTQPSAEARAMANLEDQGYRPFCPRMRRTVRHARQTSVKLVPLFPAYFFVPLDLGRDRWRAINGTRGVVRLIVSGDRPLPVPNGVVETLLARVTPSGATDWSQWLRVGQPVRVVDGPFSNMMGTLENLDAAGRVRVLLELLGRPVSVALAGENVAPAG